MILSFNDKSPIIPKSCYISESSDLIGDVTLGEDVSIWFGTVIRGDMHSIYIGNGTNIQDNSTIHVTTNVSKTSIGDNVTIGHNAIIHGSTIEDQCLIGMGSILMDNAYIGQGSIIGAGSLIPPDTIIPPQSLVIGVPGKIIRKTNSTEIKMIIDRAKDYVKVSKKYQKQS